MVAEFYSLILVVRVVMVQLLGGMGMVRGDCGPKFLAFD